MEMKKDDEKVKRLAAKEEERGMMGSGLVKLCWHILINFPFPPSEFFN